MLTTDDVMRVHHWSTSLRRHLGSYVPRVLGDRRAVTSIEYVIIASIIVIALIVSVPLIGPELSHTFAAVSSEL